MAIEYMTTNTDWTDTPTDERIAWYRVNIKSLLNYLYEKDSFSVVEQIISKQLLEGITARAKLDIRHAKAGAPPPDTRAYYDAIGEVLQKLPVEESERSQWQPQVRAALDRIRALDRE